MGYNVRNNEVLKKFQIFSGKFFKKVSLKFCKIFSGKFLKMMDGEPSPKFDYQNR